MKINLFITILLFIIACSSKDKHTIYKVTRTDWTGKSYYSFQVLKDSANYRRMEYNYYLDSFFHSTVNTKNQIVKDKLEKDTVFWGQIKLIKNLNTNDCWEFSKEIFFGDEYLGCIEKILKDTIISNFKIADGYVYVIKPKDKFHADDELNQRIFFDKTKNIIVRLEGFDDTEKIFYSEQIENNE